MACPTPSNNGYQTLGQYTLPPQQLPVSTSNTRGHQRTHNGEIQDETMGGEESDMRPVGG